MKGALKITLLFVIVLWAAGCGKDEEKTGARTGGGRDVPVEVTEVTIGDLKEVISLTGDVRPWREVNIVPDVPGKVAKIYVKEGDRVEKGQLLAKLDTRAAELQLEQAKAGLAVAQANFNSASKDWERIQELHEKGTVSPQQYEKVQLAYEAAKAQLQQAKSALNLARHQLEVSAMRAPFSGVITGKNINEGEYINPAMSGMGPGGSSVLTLMDLSKVKVRVNIPERDIGKIHVGQEAHITADPYPGRVFIGRVSSINPAADRMSRTFKVEITVPNGGLELRAGMYARVKIITAESKNVPVIPVDGVISQGGENYVYVVENGRAFKRPVQLGLREGSYVEVIDGLREGEKIITTGKEMVKDGAACFHIDDLCGDRAAGRGGACAASGRPASEHRAAHNGGDHLLLGGQPGGYRGQGDQGHRGRGEHRPQR